LPLTYITQSEEDFGLGPAKILLYSRLPLRSSHMVDCCPLAAKWNYCCSFASFGFICWII